MTLFKFSQESQACCGFAGWVPWRLGHGWLISFDSSIPFNESRSVVFESPGESFPTPAGVMASGWSNIW